MILYKYTDLITSLNIIIKNTFKFTKAIDFNDPTEISTCLFNDDGLTNHVLSVDYGILCLTKSPLNSLMWSHYASRINELDKNDALYLEKQDLLMKLDNDLADAIRVDYYNNYHTGLVFGIDVDLAGFNNDRYNLLPAKHGDVIYCESKPKFDYKESEYPHLISGNHLTLKNIELLKNIFLYKSKDWSYEEEVRIVRYFRPMYHQNGIIEIDKKAIKEVYIGFRNSYNKKYIDNFKLIINKYIPECQIYLCKNDPDNWNFIKEKVP